MILLDTHVLIWTNAAVKRLSRDATRAIQKARRSEGGLCISAITLWELALLFSKDRLQMQGSIEASVKSFAAGLIVKPITPEIAALATHFPADYPGDPADRIIGATARAEGLILITKDEKIRKSPLLETLW